MMIPLVVSTVLFNAYIRQQHFRVAEYLPLRECVKMDMENGHDFDLSFIKDAYLQDELSEKIKVPDNLPDEGAEEVGLLDS